MQGTARDLSGVLTACGPDGRPIFSYRDRIIAIALLAAAEGTPLSALGAARSHVMQLYRWAGVTDDDAQSAAQKIDTFLEANPIHPSLLGQLNRVLRERVPDLASSKLAGLLGNPRGQTASSEQQQAAARGGVLSFLLDERSVTK